MGLGCHLCMPGKGTHMPRFRHHAAMQQRVLPTEPKTPVDSGFADSDYLPLYPQPLDCHKVPRTTLALCKYLPNS